MKKFWITFEGLLQSVRELFENGRRGLQSEGQHHVKVEHILKSKTQEVLVGRMYRSQRKTCFESSLAVSVLSKLTYDADGVVHTAVTKGICFLTNTIIYGVSKWPRQVHDKACTARFLWANSQRENNEVFKRVGWQWSNGMKDFSLFIDVPANDVKSSWRYERWTYGGQTAVQCNQGGIPN